METNSSNLSENDAPRVGLLDKDPSEMEMDELNVYISELRLMSGDHRAIVDELTDDEPATPKKASKSNQLVNDLMGDDVE